MKSLVVLGPGCARCQKLAQNTEEAAKALGIEYELVKITDVNAIVGFGVMMTPALMIDDEIRVSGRVPPVEEIKKMLS
ncbi:MAG: thioredoxin family protein [bacterium]